METMLGLEQTRGDGGSPGVVGRLGCRLVCMAGHFAGMGRIVELLRNEYQVEDSMHMKERRRLASDTRVDGSDCSNIPAWGG